MDLDVGRKLGESRLALVSHFPLRYGESVGGLDSDWEDGFSPRVSISPSAPEKICISRIVDSGRKHFCHASQFPLLHWKVLYHEWWILRENNFASCLNFPISPEKVSLPGIVESLKFPFGNSEYHKCWILRKRNFATCLNFPFRNSEYHEWWIPRERKFATCLNFPFGTEKFCISRIMTSERNQFLYVSQFPLRHGESFFTLSITK